MAKITIQIEDDDIENARVDVQIFGDFYNEESPAADLARVVFNVMMEEMQGAVEVNKPLLN